MKRYSLLGLTTLLVLANASCAVSNGAAPNEESQASGAAECTASTAAVYHLVNPSTGASLYTLSATEAANAKSQYGFTEDHGTAFRAATYQATGLAPVYRLYNSTTRDFFWTIDANERDSAISRYGYTSNGVGFYASVMGTSCLVPVYRYVHTTLHKHRFAVSTADRNALAAAGWESEGLRFYAAAATTTTPVDAGTDVTTTPVDAGRDVTTTPVDAGSPTDSGTVDTRFSIAVLPDTQREMWTDSDVRFNNRMQWLADNRSSLDLRYVMQVGDLVDWDTADHIHYVRASNGTRILENAGIPFTYTIGNHDSAAVCPGGSACPGADTHANLRVTTTYNTYFPTTRFPRFAGAYQAGKIDNAYHTFTAGGLNWLVMNYEMWPRPAIVTWMRSVLANFPHHNVILITHDHLTGAGTIVQDNGGYGDTTPQYVFDNVIKQFANVRFVFSGHRDRAGFREDTGVNGNKIYSFLNCYHDMMTNPVRLLELDTSANSVRTWVYAPYTNQTFTDGSSRTLTGVSWVR